jgi:mono/diheme cytochrome c family protein
VIRALFVLIAAVALSGCDLTMTRQPRYGYQSKAPLFPDDTESQTPPDGVVAQGAPAWKNAAASPPAATPALLARGRERHAIFCQPCHGVAGDGDGVIVQRGFPRPPSYQDLKVRGASGAQLFDVITHGYGVMFPYAERIPPEDRWAIVAYVRALEVAHDLGAPNPPPAVGGQGGRT